MLPVRQTQESIGYLVTAGKMTCKCSDKRQKFSGKDVNVCEMESLRQATAEQKADRVRSKILLLARVLATIIRNTI